MYFGERELYDIDLKEDEELCAQIIIMAFPIFLRVFSLRKKTSDYPLPQEP